VPVIEVSVESGNLFSLGAAFDILLEAHDRRGNVVGEAKAGDRVNPATGIMTLQAGERVQVTLKMQLEFEGKFTVKALNRPRWRHTVVWSCTQITRCKTMDTLDQKLLAVFEAKWSGRICCTGLKRHQRADLCAGIFAGALLCQ